MLYFVGLQKTFDKARKDRQTIEAFQQIETYFSMTYFRITICNFHHHLHSIEPAATLFICLYL